MNILLLPLCLWMLDKPVEQEPFFVINQQQNPLQDRYLSVEAGEQYFSVFWHGPDLTNFSGFSNVTQLKVETTFEPSVTKTNGYWIIKFKQ